MNGTPPNSCLINNDCLAILRPSEKSGKIYHFSKDHRNVEFYQAWQIKIKATGQLCSYFAVRANSQERSDAKWRSTEG